MPSFCRLAFKLIPEKNKSHMMYMYIHPIKIAKIIVLYRTCKVS